MASNPPQALRLTFAYPGGQIRIVGSERIAMIVPAMISTPPQPGQTGYWFVVLDEAGRVIYHRPLHSPIRIDVEAFSPDPRQSITRVPLQARDGQFTVLIPDSPDARTFALHGPGDPARPDEAARELLRLDIDALRRMKPPQRVGGGTAQSPGGGGATPSPDTDGTTSPKGENG